MFYGLLNECSVNFRFVNLLWQEAWADVEHILVKLAQTRSQVEKLQHCLKTRKKEAELEVSGTAEGLHNDTIAL